METRHLCIRVFGRVQGVAFRHYTRQKALSLGLTGFVKNLADGSVYIEASGGREAIALFTDWCRQGPPAARVQHLRSEEIRSPGLDHFSIR